MADSTEKKPTTKPSPRSTMSIQTLLFVALTVPVAVFVALYNLDPFDPAPMPAHTTYTSVHVPVHFSAIVGRSERVADGLVHGPEDLAYDAGSGWLYTSCSDGWIRRVGLGGLDGPMVVEDWANVGGDGRASRPLGIAFGPDGRLVIADAYRGLLKVTEDRKVDLLTDEAEGVKFRLTDGVDVASDGTIYFTDASYKYSLHEHMEDVLGARPHGRLMSFNPTTGETCVLVRDLYFANGVAVSPDQDLVLYCETLLRRCMKYHIKGEKKETVEVFIDNIPGFPDNIRHDGEGKYWIGLATGRTLFWDVILKYPFLRKILVIMSRYVELPNGQQDGGVLEVDLEGRPVALYTDPSLGETTVGLKIGNQLYYGSLVKSYISRMELPQSSTSAK
ncbi:hypothetical protein QJS10_CPA01g00277 [Acorus calamus]|uniref:Strictosidine synthase conserved region domain-containing protein n=1 Tax=Acorus calamus TaxID=4465 RepID=A0AAV9FES3_ACOCL|nr:hypothetical protein QJS10_CPA01g00277 [Acorus calamus]